MYTAWAKHLKDPEEKQRFEKSVYSSRRVLNRLKEILDEQEQEISSSEIEPKHYDVANWSHKQAHSNGYKQCLKVIKKLIDLDQQNIPDQKETK